ncbi:hypothetical protein F5B19DRAFT_209640 [Rostrohypoxylon terebratum]|nr:hypothetical protein F5B19DRAFT_209640 [Rostrohypoxylon terebratum]
MVAITTSHNPQAPTGKQINLFYNTATRNLALEQRCEGKTHDIPEPIYVGSGSDQPGHIINPSHIASATLEGVNLVFGITEQTQQKLNLPAGVQDPGTATQNDVSILSPIYRSLISTDQGNTAIAACSSAEVVWIFYLSGVDQCSLMIKEEILGDSNPAQYNDTPPILPGSGLAAYYVPESDTRFVIYQSNNSVREFQAHGSDTSIQYAEAAKKSSLGVVYANGKAYLYYRNNANDELRKVVKENGVWGSAQVVTDSRPVDPDSQISVVYAHGYNHVFYSTKGTATQIVHVKDFIGY